jgi:hypothetical protein
MCVGNQLRPIKKELWFIATVSRRRSQRFFPQKEVWHRYDGFVAFCEFELIGLERIIERSHLTALARSWTCAQVVIEHFERKALSECRGLGELSNEPNTILKAWRAGIHQRR